MSDSPYPSKNSPFKPQEMIEKEIKLRLEEHWRTDIIRRWLENEALHQQSYQDQIKSRIEDLQRALKTFDSSPTKEIE